MSNNALIKYYLEEERELLRLQMKVVEAVIRLTEKRKREREAEEAAQKKKKAYIYRNRELASKIFHEQYFLESMDSQRQGYYPDHFFCRRFRIDKQLFLRILNDLQRHDGYFRLKTDAAGRPGMSPYLKLATSLRQLAYGVPPDMLDDQYGMAESTTREALRRFCKGIIAVYKEEYLGRPNAEDIQTVMEENSMRGFPGMLGSLDCMHWEWKNCPVNWQGQFKGKEKVPTIILEAVASKDLWIWHAFFGLPGALNDINVLDRSSLFRDLAEGRASPV